jgi:branched-chain amino acid transport system ATP-binding protein
LPSERLCDREVTEVVEASVSSGEDRRESTPPGPDRAAVELEIRDLVVRRGGATVVGPVSMTVRGGEIVALIGANGAGKTSLAEAVGGLIRTKTGVIRRRDEDISRLRAEQVVRRGVALVPEGRQLFIDQTVEDNLILGCYRHVRDKAYVQERLADAFARFPVIERKRRHPAGTLSGGEQQMLALSRALMSKPRVLLLDEPSTGLAPLVIREVMRSLEDLRAQGLATLLIEQLVNTALKTADRGYVLSRGKIVAEGTAAELAGHDQLITAYLGGYNSKRTE